MKKYVILADSSCDLSPELRQRFGVVDYVKGSIHMSNGKDFVATLDWDNISRDDFYSALSNKKINISTSPANMDGYYEAFKSYAEQGIDILSMSLSSKISSTYHTAVMAAEKIKDEYPDINIKCVDTYRMSGAEALLSVYAHQMQKDGASMEAVVAWLEENKYRVHQMGPIDDLMFVARRGRISKGKAIMGTFVGVRPMGDCSADGYVSVLGKSKGIKNAFATTLEYIKLCAEAPEDQIIIVCHTNREEGAQKMAQMIKEQISPREVLVTDVFASCGANIGPGMIGGYFLGAPVSEDGEAEKALYAKAAESINK